MISEHAALLGAPTAVQAICRTPGIGEHVPHRPDWECAAPGCGEPWPCPVARATIGAAAPDRVNLSITMATILTAAVADLGESVDPGELFYRMLRWTR
ncbi:hypothetical protein V6U90_07990 [Micromonospora sp. CPCC 206060]|uniref:hypothetical protein n=1 Tax=Micromonospora sp. CPCC 206060 TaxID=3122406 RepID=UPI002FF0823B